MRKVYELICCLGSIVQWWDDLPSRLRQDIEGSGAEPGSIVKARRLFEYYCPKKSEADATLTAAAQGHGEPSSDRKAELVQIFEKASKSPTNCINPPFDCVSLNLLPTTCAEIASILDSPAPTPLGRADDDAVIPKHWVATARRIVALDCDPTKREEAQGMAVMLVRVLLANMPSNSTPARTA